MASQETSVDQWTMWATKAELTRPRDDTEKASSDATG